MRLNSIFSPVQIVLDKPEEVKELISALDELLHGPGWRISLGIKYPIALQLLEALRKVPLNTKLQ